MSMASNLLSVLTLFLLQLWLHTTTIKCLSDRTLSYVLSAMKFVVGNGVQLRAGNKRLSVSIQSVPKYLPEQVGILIYDKLESEVRK